MAVKVPLWSEAAGAQALHWQMTWRLGPQYLSEWHKAPEFTINGKEENCVKLCFLDDVGQNRAESCRIYIAMLLLIEFYWGLSQSMPSGLTRFRAEWVIRSTARKRAPGT
jgi:hypothetical protein